MVFWLEGIYSKFSRPANQINYGVHKNVIISVAIVQLAKARGSIHKLAMHRCVLRKGALRLFIIRAKQLTCYGSVSQPGGRDLQGGCEGVFRGVVRLFIKYRYFFKRKEF